MFSDRLQIITCSKAKTTYFITIFTCHKYLFPTNTLLFYSLASRAGVREQETETQPGGDEAKPAGQRSCQQRGPGIASVQGAPGAAQLRLRGAGRP